MHRFIVTTSPEKGFISLTDREQVHQIRDVLRLQVGEALVLIYEEEALVGRILKIDKAIIEIKIMEKEPENGNKKLLRKVILYCAVLKRDNFEWVAQKATEVGVNTIVPIITQHTIKQGLQQKRLERIAQEAAEQSGRTTVPQIWEPVTFEQALAHLVKEKMTGFFLDSSETPLGVEEIKKYGNKAIGIFVGPEGGWTPEERTQAESAGCLARSLGPLTLRAETAAIVGTYLAASS